MKNVTDRGSRDVRGRVCRWLLVTLPLGALLGCQVDDEATIPLPAEPLAVGAYHRLTVEDACTADPKLPICSTERLVSLETIQVADERVAQVLRMEELPEGLRVEGAPLAVLGASPGNTKLHVAATFDDGSRREADAGLEVATVDRVLIHHRCPVRGAGNATLVAQGTTLDLEVELRHGDQLLAGEHPAALTGAGLTRLPGDLDANIYEWTCDRESGRTLLHSPLVPNSTLEFTSFAPAAQKLVSLEPASALVEPSKLDSYILLIANVQVDGETPCSAYPLDFESLTPKICLGPEGEESWTTPAEDGIDVRPRATGKCRLRVAVAGTTATREFSFSLQVEPETEETVDPLDPCEDVTCEAAPESCPAGDEMAVVGCCEICRPIPDPTRCAEERVTFDALYDEAWATAREATCLFDSDCTFTTVAGPCRLHCGLPIANEAVGELQNAVAAAAYTSCPHCEVPTASDCVTSGRPYCDGGTCAVGPTE